MITSLLLAAALGTTEAEIAYAELPVRAYEVEYTVYSNQKHGKCVRSATFPEIRHESDCTRIVITKTNGLKGCGKIHFGAKIRGIYLIEEEDCDYSYLRTEGGR